MLKTDTSLLFATRNSNKVREMHSLLGDFLNPIWNVYDIASWGEPVGEVVEDQPTFWQNAVKKALEISLQTGSATLADDSGLVVDALDGQPGVHSARYAGPGATDALNNQKLLAALKDTPDAKRSAHFTCVIALALPNNMIGRALLSRTGIPFEEIGEAAPTAEAKMVRQDQRVVVWFRGEVPGTILSAPRGINGFGYDPLFYAPEFDATLAEIPLAQKNSISHRARAIARMSEFFTGNP